MSYISVDIDIDDIISDMGRYDRKEFFKSMQEAGYISKSCFITDDGEVKASKLEERRTLDESNDDFNKALQKLFGNGWKLTKEQEEYIIELSKRF
jgi:hypothetical protein